MGGVGGGAWANDCCDGSDGAAGGASRVVRSGLRAAAGATEAAAEGSRGTDTAPAAAGTFGGCGRALAGAAGDSANGDVCGDGIRTLSALAQVLPTDSDDEQPTDTEEVCGSRCSWDAEEGISSGGGGGAAHGSDDWGGGAMPSGET